MGELENFPAEAQLKIQEAGGFEPFLLESLRFIKMGRSIGLAKHAVSLQQAGRGAGLDDLDVMEDPDTNSSSPVVAARPDSAFTSCLNDYSSAQTDFCPVLPSPYIYGSLPPPPPPPGLSAGGVPVTEIDAFWTAADGRQQDSYFLQDDDRELDLYCGEVDGGDDPSSARTDEGLLKKHAAAQVSADVPAELRIQKTEYLTTLVQVWSFVLFCQTCQESVRSVAVITEPHEPFESCQVSRLLSPTDPACLRLIPYLGI